MIGIELQFDQLDRQSRQCVREYCPLAQSLEWELGQEYLRQRGNKAFISDASPVPFVINNDGTLSRHAADVFVTSLLEADKVGALPDQLHVLELGIGVGLFARFFLDHVQELCRQLKKDYYQRLTYVAADRSQRMLSDLLRHGILANHPGRVRVRQVDAMQPEHVLPNDVALPKNQKPLRAVFLNYLLDCLPCSVLKFDAGQATQLYVRTCVARNIKLADYTDLTAEQLRQRAASSDPKARAELLEVYGLFASEYDYRPVELRDLPYGDFAAEYGRRCTGAAHSPHHSPKEWADKYKGPFDGGWEKYREDTYKRQLDMGICQREPSCRRGIDGCHSPLGNCPEGCLIGAQDETLSRDGPVAAYPFWLRLVRKCPVAAGSGCA